ncbi:hypothetical protein DUNSADRAFT_4151 [Dunaliella salina]|uniref:sucrose-phosphate synthase n=1 Tax=Dunaliella salina TaxID=3046 RepID=A0ABQ7GSJ0_DUNSA|nr:hypothetical protein DUNSADRAFT_4151 [Dunaliella salina]|eukprot:KAF5837580.1 hypothetical protein DUNSADRAFT_4151 [Dunaliella salina]
MSAASTNNQWIESYLDALLSKGGLSAEHVEQPPPKEDPEAEGKLRVDEDSSVTARFYVHQILSLNEENIRNTWSKISRHPGGAAERDVRMEQLIWRVWALKRRHAGVKEAKKHHHYEEQGAFVPPAFTEHEADATTRMTIDELNALEREAIEAQRQGEGAKGAGMDTLQEEEVPEAKSDVSWDGIYSKAKQGKPASPFASQRALDQMTGNLSSMSGSDIVQEGVRHAGPSSGTNAMQPDALLVSRFPRLYLVLISLHGLVRGERMELGRDPDTGGQIKYVVEVAKALARIPSVARVDLLTRRICDPSVDASYGQPEEALKLPPMGNQPAVESGADGGMGGAYIVRLPCGPTNVYLKKEDLWPHIREFADNAITHTTNTLAKLQEGKEGPCELYTIHGHYADAGEVAALMAHTLGVECVLTGHSLGRNKREHLLKSGTIDYKEMEATYRISRRIEAEERALDAVSCVFTSTQQEVAEQWGTYDGYSDQLSAALQLRPCRGYHVPRMAVIPPGLDFSNLKVSMPNDPWEMVLGPNYREYINSNGHREAISGRVSRAEQEGELELSPKGQMDKSMGGNMKTSASGNSLSSNQSGSQQEKNQRLKVMAPTALGKSLFGPDEPAIWKQIGRFLRHPGKPVILAMSRPDAKKNVTSLVRAYGSSRVLRDLANLVLVLGNRDIIDSMAPGSCRVMNEVLKLIDAYDLYGSVAYPKKHSQSDISDIYLLAAATHGVFVNPALQEPFGLTLIEAAAHGVPTVATTHGGPVDIVATLHNGVLVEPTDVAAIRDSLISIITSAKSWEQYSESGRRNITAYSWPSHCARYLHTIEDQKATSESEGAIRLHGFAPGGPVSGDHRPVQRTLSLTYDDLGNLARTIAGSRNANSVDVIGDAVTSIINPQANEQVQSHPGGSEKAAQSAANADSNARDEEERERSSASTMLRAGSMPPVAATTVDLASDAEGQRGNRYRSGTLQISTRGSGPDDKPARSASAVRVRGDGSIQRKESSKGQDSFSRLANQLIPATPEARHEHFMVLCVDSMTDMEAAAALIKDSLAKGASNGPNSMHCNLLRKIAGVSPQGELGVGIMCNWTCKDARTVLKQQGVNERDLAFFVCNAGSLVWHTNMDKGSEAQEGKPAEADKPELTCDEQWEQHINFRWDSRVVQQVLQRIIDSDVGWGKLAIARDSGDGKTQPAATTSVSMKLSPQSSPLHQMVEVEVLGAVHNPSATPTKAAAQRQPLSLADVGLQLLGAFRRKLRMSGVRAQCVVSPQDLDISVVLHITPLRCSRALAMRHLAFRFKRPIESAFTVVTFTAPQVPGASTASGSASDLVPVEAVLSPERKVQVSEGAASPMLLTLRCSDGEDLLGGVQRVVLLPSAHSVASAAGSSQQPQAVPSVCFTVDAGVYTPREVASKASEAEVEAAAKQPGSRVIVVRE